MVCGYNIPRAMQHIVACVPKQVLDVNSMIQTLLAHIHEKREQEEFDSYHSVIVTLLAETRALLWSQLSDVH